MLVFKEALDNYVSAKVKENTHFLQTTEFNNYVQYLKKIMQSKVYKVEKPNMFLIPLEISTNTFFRTCPKEFISSRKKYY